MTAVIVDFCSCRASPGAVALRRALPPLARKAERSARSARRIQPRNRFSYSIPATSAVTAPRCRSANTGEGAVDRPAAQPQQDAAELQDAVTADAANQEQAWQLLQEFTRLNARGLDQGMLDSAAKRSSLRAATLVAIGSAWPAAGWDPAGQPSSILLGIVSSDVRLAMRALRDYLTALHLPFVAPTSRSVPPWLAPWGEGVQSKRIPFHKPFSSACEGTVRVAGTESAAAVRGACYVKYTAATGSCHVSQYGGADRGVLLQLGQHQVGHLPLGLFDLEATTPARALE